MSEPMTTQQMFNKVATHLLTQRKRSRDHEDINCRYRGASGLMCAVGCLIKDDQYSPKLEGSTVSSRFVQAALVESLGRPISEEERRLLNTLQGIHDRRDPQDWEYRLQQAASRFQLKWEVDEALVRDFNIFFYELSEAEVATQ